MKRPFSELPALGDDRAAYIVHRSPLSYLILNRYPYNPGHLLAVPFREVAELEELSAGERSDLIEEIAFGKRLLTAASSRTDSTSVSTSGRRRAAASPTSTPTSSPAGTATRISCR